jgi:hypothetical protein
MGKPTYKYRKQASIIGTAPDEYDLTENEYYRLYSFFVTYSMCQSQSSKNRSFVDYGWPENNIQKPPLHNSLKAILDVTNNSFVVIKNNDDGNSMSTYFQSLDLPDGPVSNVEYERAVMVYIDRLNMYMQLFYRIRDALAHGNFSLRISKSNEKMIVMQDNDRNNVTARIVLKLNTLLQLISVIDRNGKI